MLKLRLLSTLLAALLGSCGGQEGKGHSVLLITLDTTSAGALSCYGALPGLTPHLDRLAREGVVYDNARTVAPLTGPAHASMLTGLYPPRHGVRVNASMALPEAARTLAEEVGPRGVATGAVIAAAVLDHSLGFSQGFAEYDEPDGEAGAPRQAAMVARGGIRWLRKKPVGEPFFLWLHFFDPHHPYEPPRAFLERAQGDPYLGEVAYMDHHIGRVLAVLEEEGLLDETLILVVGDHGEGRGLHGEDTHGNCVFDSTLRVPLVVRYPDGWGGGERYSEPVSVVDVQPTVLEAFGLAAPSNVDGRSLYRTLPDPERGVYFESYLGHVSFGWSHLVGWADRKGKFIHGSSPEFYVLMDDSQEHKNRISTVGSDVGPYRRSLGEVCGRGRLERGELQDSPEDLQAQIADLGYAGTDSEVTQLPDPLDGSDRPSPHARITEAREFQKVHLLVSQGRFAEALPILLEMTEEDGTNPTALYLLGRCLMKAERYHEAIAAFERAIDLRDGRFSACRLRLARCYEAIRITGEAR